ncbi:MAG: hydrogenase 4 subunit F [Candidatus Scalindua sp.]|nr:hydrogenase 4 subunit F [Candidatus Scalindua sp.]
MLIFFLILPPCLAAMFSVFVQKRTGLIERFTFIASVIELSAGLSIVTFVQPGKPYSLTSCFSVDALGAILILMITVIGLFVSWYSISYLRYEVTGQVIGFSRVRQYYIFLNLFLMAMLLAVTTTSPIIMWIAIEGTTLSTAFLISFYNDPSAVDAAWKYLIVNSVGLLLGFMGTLLFFSPVISSTSHQGFVFWDTIFANAQNSNPFIAKIAFVFVLIGYGTKMGLVPMHTWLPDAHSKAPVPISSLLSGVLLSVAFFAILHFKKVTDAMLGPGFAQNLLMVFGTISVFMASFFIYNQKSYKRLLAYSSIEHMGIIALGYGFGGIGAFAALLHMIFHALAKSLLFLSAGNVYLRFKSTKILDVKGALSALPITSVLLLIGFLAITGVPPFGIFFTELYILASGITNHPVITIIVLFSLVLIFAGFLRHFTSMVFGKTPDTISRGESNMETILPLIVMTILFIIISIYLPSHIKSLIDAAVSTY